MTSRITIGIFALIILLSAPLDMAAQDSAQQGTTTQKTDSTKSVRPQTRKLTGCIVRGDAVDRYKFLAQDGTVWDIVRKTTEPKMDPHAVGHKVTLVAKVTPNPYDAKLKPNASTVKGDLAKNNAGTLEITKLTTVGDACTG